LEKGTRGECAMGLARAEEEERVGWEKQRSRRRRRRRSNLGFARWSPRLMKMERRKKEWLGWGLRARVWGCDRTSEIGVNVFPFYTVIRFTFRCELGSCSKLGPMSAEEDTESKVSSYLLTRLKGTI
jgi:hypothetical protein